MNFFEIGNVRRLDELRDKNDLKVLAHVRGFDIKGVDVKDHIAYRHHRSWSRTPTPPKKNLWNDVWDEQRIKDSRLSTLPQMER